MYSDANVRAPYVWWSGAISNPNDTEPQLPTSFLSMAMVVMKVVGIDLIKLFRNFKFEKSTVILTGYMAIAGYFFR